jgi:hypothetical protein
MRIGELALHVERSDMSWRVLVGDDTMIARDSRECFSWPSHEKALDFARKEIGRGRCVVEIQGPTGRTWNEKAVRRLLERL